MTIVLDVSAALEIIMQGEMTVKFYRMIKKYVHFVKK